MNVSGVRGEIPAGISVPDHGARIKAVEALLREGLGRVGEAEIVEPRMPTTVDEAKALSMDELALVIAMSMRERDPRCRRAGRWRAQRELQRWEPGTRETLARALAEVG